MPMHPKLRFFVYFVCIIVICADFYSSHKTNLNFELPKVKKKFIYMFVTRLNFTTHLMYLILKTCKKESCFLPCICEKKDQSGAIHLKTTAGRIYASHCFRSCRNSLPFGQIGESKAENVSLIPLGEDV